MAASKQNPLQDERVLFPFGDGAFVPDIRYDPVFKAVFTRDTSNSRVALSDLISALIGRTVAVDTMTAGEPPVDDIRQRYVRFDVACKTANGELINVEMSFYSDTDEPVRLEYYAARLFTGQDLHGKDKDYNTLKESYQIAILARGRFFPDKKLTHTFSYYDPDALVSLGGKTRIITVELVKTKPIADKPVEAMTNAELWAFFFQYLTDPGKRSKINEIINREEGIAMAAKSLGTFTQSELEYLRQTAILKRELDLQSAITHARRRAQARARVQRAKGRKEARLDIARKMKEMGDTAEKIQTITGLSTEIIAQL